MKRFLSVLCAAALMAPSCLQQDSASAGGSLDRVPIFRVVTAAVPDASGVIDIDGRKQEIHFKVMSSGQWTTAWMADEGLSLLTTQGSAGSTDVVLSASENTSGAVRSASLAFLFEGEVRYDCIVRQGETAPYLEIDITDHVAGGFSSDVTIAVDANEVWNYSIEYEAADPDKDWVVQKAIGDSYLSFSFPDNNTGAARRAEVLFYVVSNPAIFANLSITQNAKVPAPVADLLDVEFGADCAAVDVSPLATVLELVQDGTVSTKMVDKYGRYAAVFSGASSRMPANAADQPGHFRVPYTPTSTLGAGLADGYTLELLFCRYDDPGTKQVKPFASTQAGGTGICFRAKEGNEINYETHTNGSWVELYSGITPVKNTYYHVVCTYDKANAIAEMYVDGSKVASKNAAGSFDYMTTNVDTYFFGIGADPNANGLGELSFNGEVVIARIFNDPVNSEQVRSMWELVK